MANLGNNFYPKLVQMAAEVQMSPLDILNIMVSESAGNPAAHNPHGGASGLIQFMPKTLSTLGFKGSPESFRNFSGEQQLPWIKKYIQGNAGLLGKPFDSPALFYVATFFPVALKLPGVRAGDPSTPIVEENPQTVTDRSGKKFSKKYYDIGLKISPGTETSAYKANPLFHGSTPGAITYGDMLNQVQKNANNPLYRKMAEQLKQSTGFVESRKPTAQAPVSDQEDQSDIINFINSQLQSVASVSDDIYKKFLPQNLYLIKINAADIESKLEFGRILSYALEEHMLAESKILKDGHNVEIECKIPGPSAICSKALNQLVNSIKEVFEENTVKAGNLSIDTKIVMNKKSSYKQIDWKTADKNYQKFLLKFI